LSSFNRELQGAGQVQHKQGSESDTAELQTGLWIDALTPSMTCERISVRAWYILGGQDSNTHVPIGGGDRVKTASYPSGTH